MNPMSRTALATAERTLSQVQSESNTARSSILRTQTLLTNLQRQLADALTDLHQAELNLQAAQSNEQLALQAQLVCAQRLQQLQQQPPRR